MSIIQRIQEKIDNYRSAGFQPRCIVISKEQERYIFLNNELKKSDSLENHFNLPVVYLDTEEIIIGI